MLCVRFMFLFGFHCLIWCTKSFINRPLSYVGMIIVTLLKFRKQRYVYGTTLNSIAKVTGVIKFDLHAEPETGKSQLEVGGNVQGIFDLGPGRFGSEAVFVPSRPGTEREEDDGYLIFFVHDENTGYLVFHSLSCIIMSSVTKDHSALVVFLMFKEIRRTFVLLFNVKERQKISYDRLMCPTGEPT